MLSLFNQLLFVSTGVTPLFTSRVKLSFLAAVCLVALRVGVGIHFFNEGMDKLKNPKPFSRFFLDAAKGPFAANFKEMVWDPDGLFRMDREATEEYWQGYNNQVINHFGFDEAQVKAADKSVSDHVGRLKSFLGSNKEDIDDYYLQLDRRDANAKDPVRQGVESIKAQDARVNSDWMPTKGKVLSGIEAIHKSLETDLNNLATPEQRQDHGRIAIGKVGARPMDSEMVDKIIPWFDTIVGLLLILGLFTRVAGTAGGLFLASVCASQWPGSPGAAPIYYQSVEMLAMFVLASMGAGYWAGLDGVIANCCGLYCSPKTNTAGAKK